MKVIVALALFCCGVALVSAQDARATKFSNDNLFSGAEVNGETARECFYEACPAGWTKQSWNKCFKFRPSAASRNAAEADCLSIGSTLALVASDSERNFLNQLAIRELPVNKGLWMGAVRRASHWFTSDLTQWTYSGGWAPGQPNYATGDCASLMTSQDQLNETFWGRLKMERCDQQLHYACQIPQYGYDRIVCGPYEEPQ